ncbi:MAG: UDP-N-acetylmuramoyl-L-alanine--D-glutamate ligase [Spirochaetota bacterium]
MNQKQKEYFDKLKNKKVHILGFLGREGMAILNFLYDKGIRNITAHDFTDEKDARKKFDLIQTALEDDEKEIEFNKLLRKDINFCYKDTYLQNIDNADVVYVSQNWYTYKTNKPLEEAIKKKDIKLTGIMDMYFELCSFPIIGITGSNGKTTTTNLTGHLISKSTDKKVFISGNDMFAKPVLNKILNYNKDEAVLVLEISNRHLKMFTHKPHIAVLTNLSPNHLAEHGGWEGYVNDKANIFRYMDKGYTVLNRDDENTKMIDKLVNNKIVYFSKSKIIDNEYAVYKDNNTIYYKENKSITPLCNLSDIKIPGEHNLENSLAALSVSVLMNADIEKLPEAIRNYKAVKERLQLVTTFKGIQFYNDISCTTPESAIHALNTLSNGNRNIIHILGGEDKDMNFTKLNELINKVDKKVIAFPGNGTDKILKEVKPELVERFNDIVKAIDYSYSIAEQGDIILISPACAFFKREYVEPKKMDDYILEFVEKAKKLN